MSVGQVGGLEEGVPLEAAAVVVEEVKDEVAGGGNDFGDFAVSHGGVPVCNG